MPTEKLFYKISEAAEMFSVNISAIRFWEKEFEILKPKKNKKGNRLFTPKDIKNLKIIHHLLKERGFTVEGAKKKLKENEYFLFYQYHIALVGTMSAVQLYMVLKSLKTHTTTQLMN